MTFSMVNQSTAYTRGDANIEIKHILGYHNAIRYHIESNCVGQEGWDEAMPILSGRTVAGRILVAPPEEQRTRKR